MRLHRRLVPILSILVGACATSGPTPRSSGILTHGVAVGEVTHDSAVVWARCAGDRAVLVRIEGGGEVREVEMPASAESDWTGRARLSGLRAATDYEYRVECGAGAVGRFLTAPAPSAPAPVRIAWSGDLGGQNVCRDAGDGYSVFSRLAAARPDVFLGVGDMVYADDRCRATGRYGNPQVLGPPPAFSLAEFRAHWAYNRSDPHLQRLLAQVPYVGVWDDHEIRNDGGASDDQKPGSDVHLFPPALRSFMEWLPLIPPADDPTRLYRRLRWGAHAELFVLDTRQYRDRNDAPDDGGKTILGERQRDWLLQGLRESDATWRIVVSSVPLSIPTGRPRARDGWADGGDGTGFEAEATAILRQAATAGMSNLVWITTDVHFATGFRYQPFADHPDFVVHEFVSGPLNAGVFPQLTLDDTFRPRRLFLWGPKSPDDIRSYGDALEWFNFGLLDIDEDGRLRISIVNARGETVARHAIERP
jgi:alkaline phosphatase D